VHYYGYRYYNPELGRWIRRDPIEESGGVNLFGFVGNTPFSLIDTDGRDVFIVGSGTNDVKFHQKIVVTYIEGGQEKELALSFGISQGWRNRLLIFWPWSNNGGVFVDECGGPKIKKITLTNEESLEVRDLFLDMADMPSHYNARCQCRKFSQYTFKLLADHYGKTIEDVPVKKRVKLRNSSSIDVSILSSSSSTSASAEGGGVALSSVSTTITGPELSTDSTDSSSD
jgi:hypothetical protein